MLCFRQLSSLDFVRTLLSSAPDFLPSFQSRSRVPRAASWSGKRAGWLAAPATKGLEDSLLACLRIYLSLLLSLSLSLPKPASMTRPFDEPKTLLVDCACEHPPDQNLASSSSPQLEFPRLPFTQWKEKNHPLMRTDHPRRKQTLLCSRAPLASPSGALSRSFRTRPDYARQSNFSDDRRTSLRLRLLLFLESSI